MPIQSLQQDVAENKSQAPIISVQPRLPGRYIQELRAALATAFRVHNWPSALSTLDLLATLGEHQGHRELCLRAQGLREVLGHRGESRSEPGESILRHYSELEFHLSHLQWLTD